MASSQTDHPDRIRAAGQVVLIGPKGPVDQGRLFPVEEVWEHKGRLVIKFGGVDTMDDAERLRGCDVCVPRSRRMPAAEGGCHLADLLGCRMEEFETGRLIGTVEGYMETGGPLVLEVRSPEGEEVLVPFARSICREMDLEARQIRVTLPEGLLDMNRR